MSSEARASETFLGLDIGTSSVKALLIDFDQRVVADVSVPLSLSRPHPLWSEQNPHDWVEGVEAAAAAIRRHAPQAFARLSGIGLSGQMHGATFLDADDAPLRPAILWNDGRAFAECAELERRVPDFRRRAGNIAMPGFTAPKVLWVAAHEPEVFAATARVLLPKDFVRLRLSGEAVSDMSDASGTLWLDIAHRRWDEELLAASGLERSQMPRLVEGSAVSAVLSPAVASAWGLAGTAHSHRRRRRRQRGLRGRRRRDPSRRGLRFARHVGRDLFGDRSLRQPARAHAARVLPRAAGALARHGGDAVGGFRAQLDRERARPRRRHRRLRRSRRGLRPVAGRRRRGAGFPALSQRRTHAAQRRGRHRAVRGPTRRSRRGRAGLRGARGRRVRLRRRRRRARRGRRAAARSRCWWAEARVPVSGAR